MSDPRSRIPSVDRLITSEPAGELVARYGRLRVVGALRGAVDEVRARISESAGDAGEGALLSATVEEASTYAAIAQSLLEADDIPSLRAVVNATGVVLHTNLGRAPLAAAAVEAMQAAAAEYSNLEFDLAGGTRGSRYTHCVSLLTELTGAEDALVVNNAAGALVLALNTVGLGAGVLVSRGELVEIGGGFRIPEVLERAGARLVEVGSTNRTRVADYADAFGEPGPGSHPTGPGAPCELPVGAILKVHRSNFRITGFTEEATVDELAGLATERGIPFIHDLGSGLLVDATSLGLPDEPRATESLTAGAHVVVVSGDKLLGATQAGILLGEAELIARMRKNPLCRALRVDKVTLAGLEATLRLYRDPDGARAAIPTLRMLGAEATDLKTRAVELRDALAEDGVMTEVVATRGAVGGGTYPGVELDSWAVELAPIGGAEPLAVALRDGSPPVIGRIVDDALRLDVRTVLPGQSRILCRRIVEAMTLLGRQAR